MVRSPHSRFWSFCRSVSAIAIFVTAVAIAGCSGGSDSVYDGSPPPDYAKKLVDAPAPLNDLYAQGNDLLSGGTEAFDRQMDELKGYPAVVNVWASWCGPCRAEFPHFQDASANLGTKVAFLGVNSQDSESAAANFLSESPLPYPSFSDPDKRIAESLQAGQGLPATAFFNAVGERTFTKLGNYENQAALEADIDRYALETG